MRKFNREAYAKESKLATVLASFGFDVILIEENSKEPGTKPDAIVNGIVMDFKETRGGEQRRRAILPRKHRQFPTYKYEKN